MKQLPGLPALQASVEQASHHSVTLNGIDFVVHSSHFYFLGGHLMCADL